MLGVTTNWLPIKDPVKSSEADEGLTLEIPALGTLYTAQFTVTTWLIITSTKITSEFLWKFTPFQGSTLTF